MASMRLLLICAAAALPVLAIAQSPGDNTQISEHARQLHMRAIVVDTHDDTTQRLVGDRNFDIAKRNTTGNIDIPRMREGGLDAIFFSIWMNGDITGPTAIMRALEQIDAVRDAGATHPNDLVLATTEIGRTH